MKTKTFVILSVILVVIAAGALIMYQKGRPTASLTMGAPMIAGIPAGEIASIGIKTPKESTVLEKGSKGWVVLTRFEYPADFSRIMDLVNAIRDAKVGRSFDSSQEIRNRLALFSPDDTTADEAKRGTLIELKNEKGTLLAGVLIGQTRKRGGKGDVSDGQYVMLDGVQQVYLIDNIFTSFETGNSPWLSKNPVRIKTENIEKISCVGPGNKGFKYVLKRRGKGEDLTLIFPSSGLNTDRTALNSLANVLSAFQIEDVQLRTSAKQNGRQSEPDRRPSGKGSVRIDFTLFNGVVYHVYPDPDCLEPGPCTLKIDVGWEKPALEGGDEEKKGGEVETVKQGEADRPDASAKAMEENERLRPWVFVVPKWRHDAFITDLQKLLVKEKEEKKG